MIHPLDQLTPNEAELAVALLKKANKGLSLHIKNVQAEEPPKAYMKKYLEAEHKGMSVAPPPRIVYCVFFVLEHAYLEELWLNLDSQSVIKRQKVDVGLHPPADLFENAAIEKLMMVHPEVQKAFINLGLSEQEIASIAPDCWMYGADADGPVPRMANFLMYMRDPKTNHPESNIYGRPLPIVPIFDIVTGEFVRIDWCATGSDSDDRDEINYSTRNVGEHITDSYGDSEYLDELRPGSVRTDMKPYNVIQPEGPSFTVNGTEVKWQKWSFRVGFNPREGATLHDIRYEGRSIFYRLAINEMTVPYGDPRPPLHRKQAFDLGDHGAGNVANSLGLGCDCLGVIKYFHGTLITPAGLVEERRNVVCMHEQDDGILLKHTNFRTGIGRVARRRLLVLQMVITVANYEYIFVYYFDQAGGIEVEVRATGIVSTQYIDSNKTTKWGTVIAPNVLASSHQHIFNLRIDPAIDGWNNTIQVCDTVRPPWDHKNPKGTGFYNEAKNVEVSSYVDGDSSVNRYVRIVNESVINPITMKPVGYKVQGQATALLLAQEGSVARNRARFATHHYWITKYRDNELFAGGVWTNQASLERGGVSDAICRNENVRDDDVVLWHSFGLTHHVRPEDWPIMPIEKLSVHLVPQGFFTENPGIDVPTSTQEFNRSAEVAACHSREKL